VIPTFWQTLHLWSTRKIWWRVERLVIFISYPLYWNRVWLISRNL